MVTSARNLSFSRSFREGMAEFLDLRNLVILIAVPVIVALVSLVENQLEMRGLIGPYSRNQTLRMLLWNVTVIVSLVALVRGSLSFRKFWSYENPVPGRASRSELPGALAALSIMYLIVLCIMGSAVMLATHELNLSGLLFLVGWCTPLLFWAACLAALLSTLADGPGAAWLGAGVFHLSVAPGLFGREVPQWIVPSAGKLIAATVEGYFHPESLLILLLHSIVYIILAQRIHAFRSREASRRWQ